MSSQDSVKVAVMQPYFLPYLGYWQLLNHVDKFVVYDDIQFTKKGWINRNRYWSTSGDQLFTVPLKKGSDFLDVRDRMIADSWLDERLKLQRRIEAAYSRAPFFDEGIVVFRECINFDTLNLFEFILNSILVLKRVLEIPTEIIVSSSIGDTRELRSKDRVIEICRKLGAKAYVNPIGGVGLYSKDEFLCSGMSLNFLRMKDVTYNQFDYPFLANLSILDLLMFNGLEKSRGLLGEFEIL